MKLLLDRGADIHALDDIALRYAAFYRRAETVKLLLDRGADIHAMNDSALDSAAYFGYLEIVKLLLDRGAIITPYMLNVIEIVRLLKKTR